MMEPTLSDQALTLHHGAVSRRTRRRILFSLAALGFPVLAFGQPLLAAAALGPQRIDALAQWASRKSAPPHAHPVGRQVPPFTLVDQQGSTVSRDSLKGHVWVGSFFLSRCAGTCPMTSAKMSQLQERVTAPGVKLVSFS